MQNEVLRGLLGTGVLRATPVSGGDINDAWRLALEDGTQAFMKANRSAPAGFFRAEAEGLDALRDTGAIRVPRVLAVGEDKGEGACLVLEWVECAPRQGDFWERFGRGLAEMHRAPAPARFGWARDNYIGSSPQANAWCDRWVDFFRDCRLAPQFRRAQSCFDAAGRRQFDRLLDHLGDHLVEPGRPSLLHGDLWSGNFITGPDGQAWLIDPAAYAGHAEADLAMTELFGGFHRRFYDAYREVNPLQPGYARRRDLYNLYHLLNHLNLFGGSYLAPVRRILDAFTGR